MFRRILVANRGEIALRVVRAAHELGVEAVVVFSEADRDSLPVLLADEAVCIGPPPARDSYLNTRNLLSAALMTGCEAIHPGYGFLAENADFVEKCNAHGLVFIGPGPEAMRALGDKASARKVAREVDCPTVPGSDEVEGTEEALRVAEKIGYPVFLKASAGGGGRGMRLAHSPQDLERGLISAQEEARSAFGNPAIYLEKYLEEIRHVEIQLLGDGQGNVIHLGERDCSIQRRHQKLLEEAPSRISEDTRRAMGEAAARVAASVNYAGAGTVEFFLDREGSFYFGEMNTRIQVEHPVTEEVTGLDLVQAQIQIAAGEGLPLAQDQVRLRGHAIECRINSEDPDHDFRPSAGVIENVHFPGGPGVRVDSHVYSGYRMPPNYDSLIAKVIAWAPTREQAIARMRRALTEMVVEGVRTTIPFHLRVLENAFYRRGAVYTNFVARRMSQ